MPYPMESEIMGPNIVAVGDIYQDLRQRGPIPRQVKVIGFISSNVFGPTALIKNTITGRSVKISINRLAKQSRFKLVSSVGVLNPETVAA